MPAAFCSMPSLFQGEIKAAVKAVTARASASFSAPLMRSATLCQRVRVKVRFMFASSESRGAHDTKKGEQCASAFALVVAFVQHVFIRGRRLPE
jgi:hypothetical protein